MGLKESHIWNCVCDILQGHSEQTIWSGPEHKTKGISDKKETQIETQMGLMEAKGKLWH